MILKIDTKPNSDVIMLETKWSPPSTSPGNGAMYYRVYKTNFTASSLVVAT